jgi:lipopolysaccharide export system permease protein
MPSRTLSLHLLRRTSPAVFAATLGLALVAWALQVVRVAPEVLTDATPGALAARVVLLPLVPILSFVWPVALAVGVVIAGRRLAVEGALDALAAAGIPPRRVLQPFLLLVLGAFAGSAVLSLVGEPLALAGLRSAAPRLAVAAFAGRASPGAFAPAGPGTDVWVGARAGDEFREALVVRRGPAGEVTEVAARSLRLDGSTAGSLALELRDGTMRAASADGVVTATFGSLRLPFDVAALRARIESMLPAGLAAPPGAVFGLGGPAAESVRDRYLVLRRWAGPLQTLLFGLLAAALAVRGVRAGLAAVVLASAVVATHALLRLLEPAAGGSEIPVWAAVLGPHLPAFLLAAWAAGRLYLPKPV